MNQTTAVPLPGDVSSRADAVNLWKHLLLRGISFHWEDDPADWVDARGVPCLSAPEVISVRRLLSRVDRLADEGCYDDALSLMKLALLTSAERVADVAPRHASAFALCGSRAQALGVLQRLPA